MEYVGAVLCGGYGTRLRPLTEELPKPLIELKEGYTILDKQLLNFKIAGIKKVYLLAGYLHEKIFEQYHTSWNDITIEYLVEEQPGGTLYALRNLFNTTAKDAVVMNGDIVSDFNLKEMLTCHREGEMLIYVTPLVSPFGVVELSDSKIVSFKEKPSLPYYINGGIYVISYALRPYYNRYERGDAEKLAFPSIATDGLLRYYKEDNVFWRSVDSVKDLEAVQSEYQNKKDKPWGYEKIIVSTEKYLTKELYIKKGENTSFHYHEKKDETLHVFRGEGYVEFEDHQSLLKENETLRIQPGVSHCIHAIENLVLNEYSTPHPEDSIRIQDAYERV
ncbi:MAG: cupin domain-containing protein [Theionarchaea archaeon]|nr:MAG: glucose-1-phosphate adenylyltransferase [Theionarchaea archaeon DG-70]MBU7009527.1 cupin domain-containing protein [Theionarchaea archaeon]